MQQIEKKKLSYKRMKVIKKEDLRIKLRFESF